jgi:hypothetical protein
MSENVDTNFKNPGLELDVRLETLASDVSGFVSDVLDNSWRFPVFVTNGFAVGPDLLDRIGRHLSNRQSLPFVPASTDVLLSSTADYNYFVHNTAEKGIIIPHLNLYELGTKTEGFLNRIKDLANKRALPSDDNHFQNYKPVVFFTDQRWIPNEIPWVGGLDWDNPLWHGQGVITQWELSRDNVGKAQCSMLILDIVDKRQSTSDAWHEIPNFKERDPSSVPFDRRKH